MKLPLIDVLKDSKLINADTASLLNFIDREQARRACLQVALSAQAYYRDHDEFPDRLADYDLPEDPTAAPGALAALAGLKQLGMGMMGLGLIGTALHYLKYGPEVAEEEEQA